MPVINVQNQILQGHARLARREPELVAVSRAHALKCLEQVLKESFLVPHMASGGFAFSNKQPIIWQMRMSILLYDGFTALDIVGGYESLARIPNMQTEFVAKEVGVYAADTRALGLYAWKTLEDAKGPDILYVPGGLGVYAAQHDPEILEFIRNSHETTTWTVGICNGVEILATAGILKGVEVTTNYFARDRVAKLGATVIKTRYHRDGKIVTGAGVSASADAGLFLTREIGGQKLAERIQLGIEYYPDPPFGPKTVDEASDEAKAATVDFESHAEEILASRPRQF